MKDKKLRITEAIVQKDYKNLQGRSAVLDCVAQDENGRIFAVEVQQEREGASPKRARYYGGLLDMNLLNPGEAFEKLPETYVIFITEEDCLGYGRPIYHMERIIVEEGEVFLDQAHIIYVNAGIQDDTELGRLMQDFHCKNADEMHSGILAERMRALKETQEGVGMMCREMEKIFEEGKEEGIKAGEKKKAIEIAKGLLDILSIEIIAQKTGLTVDEVKALKDEVK